MSLSFFDFLVYAGAMAVLFLTPGPVWVALTARALSNGFHGAWPLALGVAVGDAVWPLLAIFGLGWFASACGDLLVMLKWVACLIFLVMGVLLLRQGPQTLSADNRLMRPGVWSGFTAGLLVILGNPKAILFYAGMLPGFFDLQNLTGWDIAGIVGISMVVPMLGNLILGLFVGRVRRLLSSPGSLRRINTLSGCLLIGVGLLIPFL